MPLETIDANSTIDELNPDWPLGGEDYPDAGDDHIRNIKAVIQQTFPNITGPVLPSQGDINTGSVPSGSNLLFYNSVAPLGWTRVPDITATRGLRVVESTTGGATYGGSHDPVLNDKVPSHTHLVNGNTGNNSSSHSHSGNTNYGGVHDHNIGTKTQYDAGTDRTGPAGGNQTGNSGSYILDDGNHRHSFATGNQSANHSHSVNITSNANGSASNWIPRYFDVIMCKKD